MRPTQAALPSLRPTIALPLLPPRLTLADEPCAARGLEERAHLGRTMAALDDLHLSGLNATHFLTVLRQPSSPSTPSTGQCSTRCGHRGRRGGGWRFPTSARPTPSQRTSSGCASTRTSRARGGAAGGCSWSSACGRGDGRRHRRALAAARGWEPLPRALHWFRGSYSPFPYQK